MDNAGEGTQAPASARGDPALVLDAVVVGYEHAVVGPVSVQVHPGERVGVFGPNGAGKSTLLKAVLGHARVHSGRFRLDAKPVSYHPQAPTRLAQMPWTGRELLTLFDATLEGLPDALLPMLDRRVDLLSGGQYQLLGIWSVLAGPANLILLDEPTSYLDREISDAVAMALSGLSAGKAAMVVSHDEEFLAQTCTRTIEVTGLATEHAVRG